MSTFRIVFVFIGLAGLGFWFFGDRSASDATARVADGGPMVEITLPEVFSANAEIGKTMFEAKCKDCHGQNATGLDGLAPPLVHKIYEPSHHADEAFQRAVALGVRQHHWSFGNMPPVDGLTRGDVSMIIAYVREMQRANGIN